MINQWVFLSILTVLVGMFLFDLIADAVMHAVDTQIMMQLEQVEKIRDFSNY